MSQVTTDRGVWIDPSLDSYGFGQFLRNDPLTIPLTQGSAVVTTERSPKLVPLPYQFPIGFLARFPKDKDMSKGFDKIKKCRSTGLRRQSKIDHRHSHVSLLCAFYWNGSQYLLLVRYSQCRTNGWERVLFRRQGLLFFFDSRVPSGEAPERSFLTSRADLARRGSVLLGLSTCGAHRATLLSH
uniref:Uncharacterized protein n=1 Tax=Entomoneis paludosa TaxID=265537 RepID=A0A6U3C2Y4_9STRA